MPISSFIAFAIAWTLLCLTPGPAVAMVISQSLRYSFRSSLNGILGLQVGTSILYVLFGFGLAGLLLTFPSIYFVLQMLGAGYLIYVGVRTLVSALSGKSTSQADTTATPLKELFSQGIITQVCNPKTVVFIFSLLPQFISIDRPLFPQLALMLLVTVIVDAVILASYAFGASTFSHQLKSRSGRAILDTLSGVIMIFIGGRLAMTTKK